MFRTLLDNRIAVQETALPVSIAQLLPEEEPLLHGCVEKRRMEIAAGRTCARAALEQLGYTRAPIRRGDNREPLWPSGVVGSITHCDTYCAAAVGSAREFVSIGIDAEANAPLPDRSLHLIAFEDELTMLAGLPHERTAWDRLLFSAKESLFKAWYPIEGAWLGFEEARVMLDPDAGVFTATVLRQGISRYFERPVTGRFAVTASHVQSALVISQLNVTTPETLAV